MPRKQSPETQVRALKRELAQVRKSAQETIARVVKERNDWKLAAETWKESHQQLCRSLSGGLQK